jgi:hypothetical protein
MATFYLLIMLRESVGRQHVGPRNKCPMVIKENTLATKRKYYGAENGPMVNKKTYFIFEEARPSSVESEWVERRGNWLLLTAR